MFRCVFPATRCVSGVGVVDMHASPGFKSVIVIIDNTAIAVKKSISLPESDSTREYLKLG